MNPGAGSNRSTPTVQKKAGGPGGKDEDGFGNLLELQKNCKRGQRDTPGRYVKYGSLSKKHRRSGYRANCGGAHTLYESLDLRVPRKTTVVRCRQNNDQKRWSEDRYRSEHGSKKPAY